MVNSFPSQMYVDEKSRVCDADLSHFAQICFCIFCMSLPAFGDFSSLPPSDAWLLPGSASGGITKQAGSAQWGHGDGSGQGWLLMHQQHVEYDLLHAAVAP